MHTFVFTPQEVIVLRDAMSDAAYAYGKAYKRSGSAGAEKLHQRAAALAENFRDVARGAR